MSSVARISQISARSETSFEDAIRVGVERANRTLRNVQGAWVKDQKVECRDGAITAYQVMLEVTFVLEG
ncbi:MAG TPA: dodecin family protein [Jiangellales bacterium]|jgi:dodecin|nr:dodecin family protein [Jiangellales bacterium]